MDNSIATGQPVNKPSKKPKKARNFHQLPPFWNAVVNLAVGLFSFACVYPFLFVVIISLTDEKTLALNGYSLFPKKWSFEAYSYIFRTGDQLLRSYGVTIFITLVGTLLTVAIVSLYAYAISRSYFKFRGIFSFIAFFTMLFGGGLVPSYIVVSQVLHLKDTIWALILPMSVSAFSILIMRTFFKTMVPDAIIESGKIDGAGEFRVFISLVLPISLPGLATIGLFAALGYWNDWFNALLYIDDAKLVPLQSLLMKIETNIQFILQNSAIGSGTDRSAIARSLPAETTRMAMVVLATLPIIFAYPFFQRYFVQGLTIGSVKE
ncbi:carbohydrate ABC transporter permease [Paenibacillus donghaensis]|uniref:carbohydrate ABC transporter permease n=1 Tax=Paenibacillus donghaensis TaxID=414771 RepID=UPI001883B08F|nr:carbohydrate ABC transporter permease [Paenibacillus donghaensis]MBE9914452.1 carbohydrate ABC transporter permease [Paenibacillus donghaensis]